MKKNKIHNLASLIHEKSRVRSIVSERELELKTHGSFFGEHYGSIIWEKVNPLKGNGIISMLLRYLTGDILPLLIGIDDHKEHSLVSQLLAKGVKGTLITKGVKLIKNLLREKLDKMEPEIKQPETGTRETPQPETKEPEIKTEEKKNDIA